MSDVPVQLIVAAFQNEDEAKEALKALKQAKKEGLIKIDDAAVLRKDEKGKIHIKETHDMGGGKGAVLGGVGGATVGLIAGAALAGPAVVGTLIGGLVAKLRDSGFSNERLETLGESLEPGTSAIVAVVEHEWMVKVEEVLAETEVDLITAELSADIAEQLEADHKIAYSAISGEEGFAVDRIAVGDDVVEGASLVVDDTEVYESQFIATPEGFAVELVAATEDGVVDEIIVGTMDDEEDEE